MGRLEQLVAWLRENERAIFRAALVGVVALAVWARLAGYFSDELGLWLDEAWWGKRAIRGELDKLARPEGFMWATHLLVEKYATEQTLRALPLFAGLTSVFVLWGLLRELTPHRWVALFALHLFALNRVAVAMSKEFKPYSLELLLHLTFVLLAVLYLKRGSRLALVLGCLLAPAAFWFAWSIVFVFPAFFLLVGLAALQRRRFLDLGAALASAALTLYVVYGIYTERLADREPQSAYWGKKYGVFTLTEDPHAKAVWFFEKLVELFAFPSYLKFTDDAVWLPRLAVVVSIALCAAGVSALFTKKRWPWLLALVLPLVVMAVISAKGHWPFGAFRTNTFTLAYLIPLLALGAHSVRDRVAALERPAALPALGAAALLFAALALFSSPSSYAWKEAGDLAYDSSVRVALDEIYAWEKAHGDPKARTPLYLDGHSCSIAEFYSDYHALTAVYLKPFFDKRIKTRCHRKLSKSLLKASRRKAPFWVLTAKLHSGETFRERWLKRCKAFPVDKDYPSGNVLIRCVPEKAPDPSAPRDAEDDEDDEPHDAGPESP